MKKLGSNPEFFGLFKDAKIHKGNGICWSGKGKWEDKEGRQKLKIKLVRGTATSTQKGGSCVFMGRFFSIELSSFNADLFLAPNILMHLWGVHLPLSWNSKVLNFSSSHCS